jgi:hypothetical protein
MRPLWRWEPPREGRRLALRAPRRLFFDSYVHSGRLPGRSENTATSPLGERLLASSDGLWSALPVEWPRQGRLEAGEEALPGWGWRTRRTLLALLLRPYKSFTEVLEPVSHGAVLGLLSAVRLPLWALLVAALGLRRALGAGDPVILRPIYDVLDPRLTQVVSLWLLLMVPVGLMLLYFFSGLTAHVALALTGGAPRSIGATMRANGYALALPAIGVAILDVPLYLGALGSWIFLGSLAGLSALYFHQLGHSLSGTHGVPRVRGFLVALLPVVIFAGITGARAILELPDLPGWSPAPMSAFLAP